MMPRQIRWVLVIVSRHELTRALLRSLAPALTTKLLPAPGLIWNDIIELDHLDERAIQYFVKNMARNRYFFVGNFPLELILKLYKTFGNPVTVVSLNLPRELRGKELGLKELMRYAKLFTIWDIKAAQTWP